MPLSLECLPGIHDIEERAVEAGIDAFLVKPVSPSIVRARRVAQLERMYDADPQLAAMTVDLMEEVLELRRKLQGL